MAQDLRSLEQVRSHRSLEKYLDQHQSIGAHLKSYCDSIKGASVNFNSKEKQEQF